MASTSIAEEETASPAAQKKADEYFARGEVLFAAGEYEKSAEAFYLAFEIAPHPSVLANIALCYEKAGRLARALEVYEEYLRVLGDSGVTDDELVARLANLRAAVGEIAVICRASSCRVRIDGEDHGGGPVKVVVDPGKHLVEGLSNDQLFSSSSVNVKAGEIQRVTLVDTRTKTEPKPATPDSEPGIRLRAPFWVAFSLTVASGAATVFFGIRTLNAKQEFDNHEKQDELAQIKKEGERDCLVTNILIGTTAASAIAAVVFAIVDATSKPDKEPEKASLSVIPGLGLSVTGRF